MFLNGTVDSSTIDIQINVNEAGFVSDPSLVDLSVPDFTIPNPNSFPDGLSLEKGYNIVKIRAIDISGSVSAVSTVTINVVSTNDLTTIPTTPNGVSIQRQADSVDIKWSSPIEINSMTFNTSDDSPISGYNVYASTGSGGTLSGYLRLNKDIIPSSNPIETTLEELSTTEYEFDINDNDSNTIRVVADLINPATNAIIRRVSTNTFSLLNSPQNRYKTSVSELSETKTYSFKHDRRDGTSKGILNADVWQAVNNDSPIYYVITSVVFDKTKGLYTESKFSQELVGTPLPIDRFIRGIRIRDQRQITQDYITEISRVQPTLSLIPGSTIREVHIEPFSNESQKIYFLLDFVHRSKSFAALLSIDDPGRTNSSIPVANSPYKQALRTALAIEDDATVQALINGAFESLAGNFGIERAGRRPAVVTQIFYTTSRPTKDLFVQQGAIVSSSVDSSAPRFRANGSVMIEVDNVDSFYNANRGRYEVKIQMVAETPGSIGNVPAKTLDTVSSGADGLLTINEIAADFGRDEASNLELAEEASRKLVSLDTGTEGGYRNIAISTPGVLEVRIIKSGDTAMMRDWDPIRKKHVGGKADIFVKGTIERTVSETFAFQFNIANNVRFDVIDATNLIFRARDSRLSEDNPIAEMLFNPSQNLGLRNQSISPVVSYDLTGVSIIDYKTIQLSTAIPQPSTSTDDFIEGDYRFRSNTKFIPNLQPIERVVSVVGEVSGSLDQDDGFKVYRTEDPLLNGFSTAASDSIEIIQVDDIPTGESIVINDEQHILIGQIEEPLNSVGINTFTIAVFNEDRSRQFLGPDNPNPDYLIIGGSQTEPVKIVRTATSGIANGETVSIDYEHDENFTVTYVINDVLQRVQSQINISKHITADVIVKKAVENPMSIEGTVQLLPNADKARVDIDVRTAYTILTDSKGVGGDIHISDVVAVIDDTKGVDFIVQPFAKMTLQNGALRIREEIANDVDEILSLSKFANKVWVLTQPLPFNTIDKGGDEFIHHGVFKDGLIMSEARSLQDLGEGENRAFIVGKDGAIIDGYSDDSTLTSAGFNDVDEIEAERLRRTANHVFISLNVGIDPPDDPSYHSFSATYVVENDVGQKDIEISEIEFLTSGDLTLVYREA
jgi:hypothetical protein